MTAEVQWYPGHMARAMRRLANDVRIADLIVEVVDARVPRSGANPALARIAGHRPRLRVLVREDLADPQATLRWLGALEGEGIEAIAIDAKSRGGAERLRSAVEALAARRRRTARAIVLGVPNAGKSTAINALAGKKIARSEDRAGVTRGAQWFRLSPHLELMDTAGILMPKIETPEAQWKLALVGAVPRARYDAEEVAQRLALWAGAAGMSGVPDLETFAQRRGFVRRGTLTDAHNAAWAFLKDVNDGKFGRMTFEEPGAR